MNLRKSPFICSILLVGVLMGAWAIQSQTTGAADRPLDFDPNDPSDIPVTTVIDIDIKGLSKIGQVLMLEGAENETSVTYDSRSGTAAGNTSYSRLVLHGIFEKEIRDWREDVISGKVVKREIELDLLNEGSRRVLRLRFFNCWPATFSFPPLSVDGSTRYMERVEFAYDNFTITN